MATSGFLLQRWRQPRPSAPRLPVLPLHRAWVAHFTGYWPAGYRPRWRRTPWWHLTTTLLSLVGSVHASVICTAQVPWLWPLLVLSWMGTVHACRKAQLVICHHAVHGQMTGTSWGDRVLVEVLSTLLLIQHFTGYRREHIHLHHSQRLATYDDPDLQMLLSLGLRPGMPSQALWRQLYWTVVAPRFHARFVWMRLRANFLTAPRYRRLMASLYVALVGTLCWQTQAWVVLLVAWIIPVFPLYHIAALLQFVSEHRWLYRLPDAE